MGQGYSLTTLSAGSAGIDVQELADLVYEKSLGLARFMKSIRARHSDGLVVIKVAMKPYPNMKLDPYIRELMRERRALTDVPNALGYDRILETSANGYLVRQYLYSSLYDRMSTRPFLEEIEKKWLSFQLLCALRDCHSRDVFHGDIKAENTLVTSWNWLYLSDFSASFKPAYLPEDNPADFSYYFDTSGRRTCYLAPERFLLAGEEAKESGKVNWAMDIFSAGCLIAELFLETPIFSLSQLYRYRKGEYQPEQVILGRIQDKDVRELVLHMIQIEPEARYSADEYLNFWRRKAFPEYFYSFLHQYMSLITDPSSGRRPITTDSTNLGESDERIERIYHDFDKISYLLGYDGESLPVNKAISSSPAGREVHPTNGDTRNRTRHQASAEHGRPTDNGSLIFLAVVIASLRHCARATSKLRACDLLLGFAERITDEAKIDRILPYAVALAADRTDIVKAAALRTITQLIALVKVVSPANAYVFPEYILPRLQPLVAGAASSSRPLVRATYASCIATLAHTSLRFLDMVQALRADGVLPAVDPEAEEGVVTKMAYQTLFDVARSDLAEYFELHTKSLLTDNDPSVRRAFLGSVSSLCVFFGSSKASEVILSHLNTYLNDKDWMLKCAFFETIVGVGTFLGSTGLEEFILPLMVQAMADPEDFVVEKVIRSFASLAELGLFQRSRTWELVDTVSRFTMHPNVWIRQAAASFLSSATTYLTPADTYCIIAPLAQPYMKYAITEFTELNVLNALKKPLPRPVFDMAVSWVSKANKGVFWKSKKHSRAAFGLTEDLISAIAHNEQRRAAFSRISKNEEDEQWLVRLRNLGMGFDDEWKLVALREYFQRMASSKPRDGAGSGTARHNNVISLKQLGITPQTVFFNDPSLVKDSPVGDEDYSAPASRGHHSIAEALLDATTNLGDPQSKQRRSGSAISPTENNPKQPAMPGSSDTSMTRTESRQRKLPTIQNDIMQVEDVRKSLNSRARTESKSLQVPIVNSETASSDEASINTGLSGDDRRKVLHHKGSAVALMNKEETSKAYAETGTTSMNAFGKVEGPHLKEQLQDTQTKGADHNDDQVKNARQRVVHSYLGNDPSVLRALTSLYQEQYSHDLSEFGPSVTPISRRQRIKRSSGEFPEAPWRPEGNLVAMFGEHSASVNRVAVAPDHAFFITGSDDGTVKIWDAARLERNVAYRSRQTYKHANGTKVKSVCFLENTHCFASADSDGSIHVVKVNYMHGAAVTRYGKLQRIRSYQLPEGEYAVWIEHIRLENHSVLLTATNKSNVIALEVRTMRTLYSFTNPVHYGAPTCFCIDRKRAWLLVGTTHGVLSLWDLRFRVRVKAWGLPGATPIHKITIHPLKGRGRWVCVAGGCSQGEITTWDVEKMQCREVYGVFGSKDSLKSPEKYYEPWMVDEERPEGMLGRFAIALEPNGVSSVDRGMRALATGVDPVEDGRESRYGFLITGGSDKKVRFWDLTRVEGSTVVSGLEIDEVRPTYVMSQPTTSLTIASERVPQSSSAEAESRATSNTSVKRVSGRPPRSTLISLQQQQLLTSHLDSIVDVALLELPYGMIVSVDRSGVIYVFQ